MPLREAADDMARRMRAALRETRAALDGASEQDPTCPRCGAPLRIRTAKRKGYNGRQFWGCSRYPACTNLQELDAYPEAAYRQIARRLRLS